SVRCVDPRLRHSFPTRRSSDLFDAVVGPFTTFFREHGRWALLMLLAISLYRMPDFVMGPMANPFYADLGIAKDIVGAVRGSFGLDRKSTRLNSSHVKISYAVFC